MVGAPRISCSLAKRRANSIRTTTGGGVPQPSVEARFFPPYQISQVNSFGENRPTESGFRALPRQAGQQVRRQTRFKPVALGAMPVSGERDARGSWRRECSQVRTVVGDHRSKPNVRYIRRTSPPEQRVVWRASLAAHQPVIGSLHEALLLAQDSGLGHARPAHELAHRTGSKETDLDLFV